MSSFAGESLEHPGGSSSVRRGAGGPPGALPLRFLAQSPWIRGALLALAVTLAYGGALDAGVSWDDAAILSENPAVRSLRQPWQFVTDRWTTDPTGWNIRDQFRPLRTLAYALEFVAFGGRAWGYHLVSILLHSLGAVMVGWLTTLLFRRGGWLAAAVWLLHPALSENALYLAAQGNLLCLLGCVGSACCFVRWLESGSTRWRVASLLLGAGAMLAYEFGALLPLLLLLIEALWRSLGRPLRASTVRRHLPYWLLLVGFLGLREQFTLDVPPGPWWGGSRSASAALQLRLFLAGWHLTLLPTGQLPRYLPKDAPSWATPTVAVLVHLFLLVLVALAVARRVSPVLAIAVAWWYVAQLPTSNLFLPNPGYPFAPRFLFLALVLPLSGAASWFAARAAPRPWLWGVAALVLAALIPVDRVQTATWRPEDGVFRKLLANDPNDTLARFNLGAYLLRVGHLRAAAEELELLRHGSPEAGPAAYLLGNTMRLLGRRTDAEGFYRSALRSAPGHIGATLELAELAVDRGEATVARRWIRRFRQVPDQPPRLVAQLDLLVARIAVLEGNCTEAAARARVAATNWPYSSKLLFEAGVQLARCGEAEPSRALRREAAQVAASEIDSRVGWAW